MAIYSPSPLHAQQETSQIAALRFQFSNSRCFRQGEKFWVCI